MLNSTSASASAILTNSRSRLIATRPAPKSSNYVKTVNGVDTYRQTLSYGSQALAEVPNREITNGGVNAVPL